MRTLAGDADGLQRALVVKRNLLLVARSLTQDREGERFAAWR